MSNELYTYIGHTIKQARRTAFTHKHITQSELARVCGVTFQQIQKYEKATNNIPLHNLIAIAKYTKKPLLDFLPSNNTEITES